MCPEDGQPGILIAVSSRAEGSSELFTKVVQEGVEKARAEATTGVLSLQQPKVVNAPFRKQEKQEVNVQEEFMQEGILQLGDGGLGGRDEELIGGEKHGQEAVEEHTQPQQQRLQEEPPASTPSAPWPPPLPELTVGKVPDLGLMEGHTQPQQQQRLQEEPPASTSPAPWPPPLNDECEDEQGVSGFGFFSSFVGWGTESGRRHLTRPRRTRIREKDQVIVYRLEQGMYSSFFSVLIFPLEFLSLNGYGSRIFMLVGDG